MAMMAIRKFLRLDTKGFVKSEAGLATVEWVALASAVVVGGMTLVWLVTSNLKAPANSSGTQTNSAANAAVTQNHP